MCLGNFATAAIYQGMAPPTPVPRVCANLILG